MSDAITITTNANWLGRRFERYLRRSIQITTRSVEEVVVEQARGLVRNAFLHMPPMNVRTFFQGKKASQKAIRATVVKATAVKNEAVILRQLAARRTRVPREELEKMLEQVRLTPAALLAKIRSQQRRDKTYPDTAPKFFTTKTKRKSVQTILETTIGATAAGWCAAADRLGIIYPPWIGRWKGRNSGSVTLDVRGQVIEFKAVNPTRHQDSPTIQRALNAAFDAQANAMRNSLIQAIRRRVLRREDVFM